jgi:integrase
LTVANLIDLYGKAICSPNRNGGALRTAREIESRLRRALNSKRQLLADNLTRGNVSMLLDKVADTHPREAEKRRQVIGAMYRWAVAKGYATIDPTAGSVSYGRGVPRDRVLAPEEIRAFWTWLDAGADRMPPDCITALRLQLCLGARIGEIAGIDASEILMKDGRLVWILPSLRSKNKRERITPLVGRAKALVETVLSLRMRGALFRTALTDRALTSADIGHAMKNRNLPCPPFNTHDLRRTVVSAMDELGVSLDTIAAVIGHQRGSRDTRTLVRHYSRPKLDSRVEAALATWDRRLVEIINASNDDI